MARSETGEDKYKPMKRGMSVTHEQLTKKTEKERIKIVKLQARLSEARRAAKLQIST